MKNQRKTHLELVKTLEEGCHAGVKLGVPDELEAARPVERQVLVVGQHLATG